MNWKCVRRSQFEERGVYLSEHKGVESTAISQKSQVLFRYHNLPSQFIPHVDRISCWKGPHCPSRGRWRASGTTFGWRCSPPPQCASPRGLLCYVDMLHIVKGCSVPLFVRILAHKGFCCFPISRHFLCSVTPLNPSRFGGYPPREGVKNVCLFAAEKNWIINRLL